MKERNENMEDQALKKAVVPVTLYLLISVSIFYGIDQISFSATNLLGGDKQKLVHILEVLVIGLLTTFMIFYLIYKFKYVEINANLNISFIFSSSPYPVLICKLKDNSIVSCSPIMSRVLGYTAKEIKELTLQELITESSYNLIMGVEENKYYINRDFEGIHFIEKNKSLLSIAANVIKYEFLDKDYLLIQCHAESVGGKTIFEDLEPKPNEIKRPFQF
ncbi:MAG: hypothetical protein K9H61_03820 [Bacteroidia bacterium]|nr:hypothetical protein [Bacteroidia bacterium]MCF8446102.1 hypothetical protein [Bacteroidia bacterium]